MQVCICGLAGPAYMNVTLSSKLIRISRPLPCCRPTPIPLLPRTIPYSHQSKKSCHAVSKPCCRLGKARDRVRPQWSLPVRSWQTGPLGILSPFHLYSSWCWCLVSRAKSTEVATAQVGVAAAQSPEFDGFGVEEPPPPRDHMHATHSMPSAEKEQEVIDCDSRSALSARSPHVATDTPAVDNRKTSLQGQMSTPVAIREICKSHLLINGQAELSPCQPAGPIPVAGPLVIGQAQEGKQQQRPAAAHETFDRPPTKQLPPVRLGPMVCLPRLLMTISHLLITLSLANVTRRAPDATRWHPWARMRHFDQHDGFSFSIPYSTSDGSTIGFEESCAASPVCFSILMCVRGWRVGGGGRGSGSVCVWSVIKQLVGRKLRVVVPSWTVYVGFQSRVVPLQQCCISVRLPANTVSA